MNITTDCQSEYSKISDNGHGLRLSMQSFEGAPGWQASIDTERSQQQKIYKQVYENSWLMESYRKQKRNGQIELKNAGGGELPVLW